MKGTRSHRLAWSIVSVLFIAGGLFVSLAIYASKLIWPNPQNFAQEFASDKLIADHLSAAERPSPMSTPNNPPLSSHIPDLVAALDMLEMPNSGGDPHPAITSQASDTPLRAPTALIDPHSFGPPLMPGNDTADLLPVLIAQATPSEVGEHAEDDEAVSVFSMGTPVADIPADPSDDPFADLTASVASDSVPAMDDAEYQLDMRIAALAQPIDTPIPPPLPVEVFALASNAPEPLPEIVFVMSEPDIWPQRVDQAAVQSVSQSLSTPDLASVPAPSPAAIVRQKSRQKSPTPMIAPTIQLAAVSDDLHLPPPSAVSLENDDDLVLQIAKVLAAAPLPLPGAEDSVRPLYAPTASPRPQQRQRIDPTPPRAADQIAEPSPPSTVPTVAVVTPASAPVTAPTRSDDGRDRMSVVGIYDTDTAPWALLETSDGRIIKATKGTSFYGMRVARIRGNKIWIRDGGMEKGLTTGQVIVLD